MSQSENDVNVSKYKPSSPRIMDQVREVLRYHHYGIRTEEAYASSGEFWSSGVLEFWSSGDTILNYAWR